MVNYNTFSTSNDQHKNTLYDSNQELIIMKCIYPNDEKPIDKKELKHLLSRSNKTTFSESMLMAEIGRIKKKEYCIVNELTIEIAIISTLLNVINPARIITEHMIDYLFDDTGRMVLPKAQKKEYDIQLENGQTKAVIYQVYESKLICEDTHHFYQVVDQPKSEQEEHKLLNDTFKIKKINSIEIGELKSKDILIIETLRRNAVYIDEAQNIKNDTNMIEELYHMLKDRVTSKLMTLEYLLNKRSDILGLAMEVLRKLDRKKISLYSKTDGGKLKRRYIPLIIVMDKMILELMLVRKYLNLEDDIVLMKNVMNDNGLVSIEKVINSDNYIKLSLLEFHHLGYKIQKTNNLKLIIGDRLIQLPVITTHWLSYNNIIKKTYVNNQWNAVITTLNYLLAEEESRGIYKKYIGGDPDVLVQLRVPIHHVVKDYRSAQSNIDSKNGLICTSKLKKSIIIIASIIIFLITYELLNIYNDMKKGD